MSAGVARQLPYEQWREIYAAVPRFCVDLIIYHDDGIVLTKRDIEPFRGEWHLPGGTSLLGESPHDTARRVAEFETGLDIQLLDNQPWRLTSYLRPHLQHMGYGHDITATYRATSSGGTLRGSVDGRDVGSFKAIPEPFMDDYRNMMSELVKAL